MYLGRIVEKASAEEIYEHPLHPYTRALLEANPVPDPDTPSRATLGGVVPNPADPPAGCSFHPRCPICSDECRRSCPNLMEVRPGHFVACFRHDEGVT